MGQKKNLQADFLFARPSAASGLARFFDFSGTFDAYNHSDTPDEADAKAMFADWRVVGDSLGSVIEQQQDELEDEKAA
jgi:hypothetical protein